MTAPVRTPAPGPAMRKFPKAPWPSPFGWLPKASTPDLALRLMILERARIDLAILEETPNRGPEIDGYLRRARVPESIIAAGNGYWCAAWAGCMWIDGGALVPPDFGSCDAWLPFMRPASLATLGTVGKPGDAVLYGKRRADGTPDAQHIGLLVRMDPLILSTEGNRGVGAQVTNNGVAVHTAPVTRTDVLGVVRPLPA